MGLCVGLTVLTGTAESVGAIGKLHQQTLEFIVIFKVNHDLPFATGLFTDMDTSPESLFEFMFESGDLMRVTGSRLSFGRSW